MGRYFNEKPDELVHGIWSWPNGKNSKDYNHDYYEKHKAKWDSKHSVDSNILDNLENYGLQANGPDQPGLSDDFQRNLAKRRIKQLGDDTVTITDIAKEAVAARLHSSITNIDKEAVAARLHSSMDLYRDIEEKKSKLIISSAIRAIADVPLAAVDTLVQAGKSIFDKLSK